MTGQKFNSKGASCFPLASKARQRFAVRHHPNQAYILNLTVILKHDSMSINETSDALFMFITLMALERRITVIGWEVLSSTDFIFHFRLQPATSHTAYLLKIPHVLSPRKDVYMQSRLSVKNRRRLLPEGESLAQLCIFQKIKRFFCRRISSKLILHYWNKNIIGSFQAPTWPPNLGVFEFSSTQSWNNYLIIFSDFCFNIFIKPLIWS